MLVTESLQLARQAFFKPFKLDEELKNTSSYLATNVPVWRVWSGLSSDERRVVVKALVAIAVGAVVWPIVGGLGAIGLGHPFPWGGVIRVSLASLGLGFVGLMGVGIAFGVNMTWALSLAGSLATVFGLGPTLTSFK